MNALAFLAADGREQLEHGFYFFGMIAFAAIGTLVVNALLLGVLYMTHVVAPNATTRFSTALRERNVLSFFAGIPVFGLFAVLGALFQNAPGLLFVSSTAFSVLLVLALAAGSEDIGRRLYWACGKEGSRASHLAAGWLIFAFGSLVPVIGWFLIFPYVTLSGLGSLAVSLLGSKPAPGPASKDVEFDVK